MEQKNEITRPERKNILDFHAVNKPYAYAITSEDPDSHEVRYEAVEPTLTDEERKKLSMIQRFLVDTMDVMISEIGPGEKAEEYLIDKINKIVKGYRIPINKDSLDKIIYYMIRDYIGYGKIDVMMRDPLIEDISCNGFNVPIYVWQREHESIPSNLMFGSEEELDSFIIRLAYRTGRMISVANPMLDATLPDGSRIQMTLGREVTRGGSTFTIRKFKADPLTIVDLINYGTLSSEMAAFLWLLIENKLNIFVCGPTACGKTTTLGCLAIFIQPDFKVVTIEDTPEIQLYQKNWIRSVSRPGIGGASEITLFDLLRAAMRQRPDYIVVGEIRGAEAYTLFQAMATGHGGISTMHADSVATTVQRLETKPMDIPRMLISNLNVVLIQLRVEKKRRVVTTTEFVGIDPKTNEIITNESFRWDAKTDSYRYLGRSYLLEGIAQKSRKSLKDIREEIDRRKAILDWMVKNGMRSFKEVTGTIRNYYASPEAILRMVRVGA